MKKRFNLVLVGPPGSGKGSQAELIVKYYKLKEISVGEILRKEKRKNTALGRRVKHKIDKGQLIDSKLAVQIVKEYIGKQKRGFLFDGFPRDLYEAKALDKMIEIDHVILLDIPQKETIRRLSNRYECACGMAYNMFTQKPKNDLKCDKCKKKLYRRNDDRPKVIKERIDIYRKKTWLVLKHYKKKIIKINGMGKIKDIFQNIKKRLK